MPRSGGSSGEAPHFLAFFSEVKDGYAANAGFMMQQMDLFLSANGIGSCWQGGPKPIRESRAAFRGSSPSRC